MHCPRASAFALLSERPLPARAFSRDPARSPEDFFMIMSPKWGARRSDFCWQVGELGRGAGSTTDPCVAQRTSDRWAMTWRIIQVFWSGLRSTVLPFPIASRPPPASRDEKIAWTLYRSALHVAYCG